MNQDSNASGRGTVVAGLFRDADRGEGALADLKAAGFTRTEISQVSGQQSHEAAPTPPKTGADMGSPFFQEHDSAASSFVAELMRLGFSKRDAHDLVDGVVKGHTLVTTDADTYVDRAVAILTQYNGDVRYTEETSRAAAGSGAHGQSDIATATNVSEEDREIQLRAERLVVDKQRVQHGEARIRKEVVTEMRTIDVPVSHEELVIERHAVTGGAVDSAPLAGETVRIPLSEEKVNISKETVVREEVEIGKRRVEGVERVGDTVRHEELRVDDATTTSQTDIPAP